MHSTSLLDAGALRISALKVRQANNKVKGDLSIEDWKY